METDHERQLQATGSRVEWRRMVQGAANAWSQDGTSKAKHFLSSHSIYA